MGREPVGVFTKNFPGNLCLSIILKMVASANYVLKNTRMTIKLMPDLCDKKCPSCSQGLKSLIIMDGDNPRRMTSEEAPCPTAALILGVLELKEARLQKTKEVSAVIDS